MPRGKKRKQAEALSGSEASKHLAALHEALEILDAWDDVADSELTGVLSQLASLLRMSEEALARMHSCDKLPFDRTSAVLVRSCGHASAPVRVAAWMAARECCLDQQELCEMLLLERALYSSAWSQLRDGVAGAATSAIVGLLQQACELSDEAVVAAGEAELTALLAAASPPVADRTRAAALELLLVLTDPTAADGNAARLLVRSAAWRLTMEAALDAPALAGLATSFDGGPPPPPSPPPPSSVSSWLVCTLAAALVLHVAASTGEAGADAHGEAQAPDLVPNSKGDDDGAAVALASLVPRALRCLGAACAQAADAGHAPPEDAAMRAALEALTNAYIGGNDADESGADRRTGREDEDEEGAGAGEAEDAATKARAEALARRATQLLPPAKLLPLVLGSLQRYLGVYEEAKGDAGVSGAGGAGGSSSVGDCSSGAASADEARWSVAARILRCAGALLSTISPAELAPIAAVAWESILRAGERFGRIGSTSQAEFLDVAALLATACIDGIGPAAATSDATSAGVTVELAGAKRRVGHPFPAKLLRSLSTTAVGWARAARRAAAPSAVALVGHVLAMLRAAGEATGPGLLDDRGYLAEMITEIGVELSHRLEASEEPLEGAEAAAALAEDADCSRRSGEPPLVSADRFRCALHELRGKLVSALREVATQRRAAREAEEDEAARAREEKLRHALALVEAAAEQV